MDETTTKTLQQVLADAGAYQGAIDGIRRPASDAAVDAMLEARAAELPEEISTWPSGRRAVACLQLGCRDHEIEVGPIDGLWGPQTDFAADVLTEFFETGALPGPWRDQPVSEVNPNRWPPETRLRDVFGPPGEAPLVIVPCPWRLRLSWDPETVVSGISCHERVSESLQRVLQQVYDHYGEDRLYTLGLDRYGGCFNRRRKRGGTSWSTHAWGIAIDWDPDRNKLRWARDRARLARPEYDAWWGIWEEEGWVSLGRSRNFDWMHVQAAKL